MKKIILAGIFALLFFNCFPQTDNPQLLDLKFTNVGLKSTNFSQNLDIGTTINESRVICLTNPNLNDNRPHELMNDSFNNLYLSKSTNDKGSFLTRFLIGAAVGAGTGWLCGLLATHGGQDSPVGPWVIGGGAVGAIGVTLFFSSY